MFIILIYRFCDSNNEGIGWILKMPYSTNREFNHFCKDIDQIEDKLGLANRRYHHIMPYIMLQSRMINPKEVKVVCINGKAQYIAYNANNSGRAISKKPNLEIFAFAERAIAELSARCVGAITNGLVRVDIFQAKSGEYKVNEFESLEASYSSTNRDITNDAIVFRFNVAFWTFHINNSLTNLSNSNTIK